MNIYFKIIIGLILVCLPMNIWAQQDPQFTQYMYNTLNVNSAYAGSRGHMSITGIHRSQWLGIDGAPQTQTLSIDSPIAKKVGLGLSIINDNIGPSEEIYIDLNFSYTIKLSDNNRLSFGAKGGGRLFNLDFTKGQSQNPDAIFQNVNDRFLPTVGAGLYLHSDTKYLGVSIPNFFADEHYDDIQGSLAAERIHIFLIGGVVTNFSEILKFKPAFLLKHVVGSPLSLDLSANFMFYNRFTIGAAYRWDDSFSGLAGFQITPALNIGYAYDYTTSELQRFTSGSHEIMIRFELKSEEKKLKSPRFF